MFCTSYDSPIINIHDEAVAEESYDEQRETSSTRGSWNECDDDDSDESSDLTVCTNDQLQRDLWRTFHYWHNRTVVGVVLEVDVDGDFAFGLEDVIGVETIHG